MTYCCHFDLSSPYCLTSASRNCFVQWPQCTEDKEVERDRDEHRHDREQRPLEDVVGPPHLDPSLEPGWVRSSSGLVRTRVVALAVGVQVGVEARPGLGVGGDRILVDELDVRPVVRHLGLHLPHE